MDHPQTSRPKATRTLLPNNRTAITHRFMIKGQIFYLTVGLYDDGTPGEIFLHIGKEGSSLAGMADSFARAISLLLQYGAPLDGVLQKFTHVRFEPSGFTNNDQIPFAKSVVDYICRWMAMKFLPAKLHINYGITAAR